MKRHYELLFIIANNVEEAKRNDLIAKFSKMAGKDVSIEKWGMRKFTNPINYRKEGFYVLFNFDAEADVPAKIQALMNITDGIERSMVIVKDDKQIAADAARKAKRAAAKAEVVKSSAPSEAASN